MLADQRYDQSWGTPASDPYLANTLRKQGELMPNFYAVAGGELANEIALLSGQGPTPQTVADCPLYANVEPAVSGSEQQVLGSGCVYPAAATTLADQLTGKGDTWKAYIQGMTTGSQAGRRRAGTRRAATTLLGGLGWRAATATSPLGGAEWHAVGAKLSVRKATAHAATATATATVTVTAAAAAAAAAKSCRHPGIGTADTVQPTSTKDPYATWTNPFVYFASIGKSACTTNDVDISRLAADLKSEKTTPTLSYIAPDPCDDGSSTPCVTGSPAGLGAADAFLKAVVPKIEASPAYKADGMIVITFDQAPQTGPYADASSCCDNPTTYPNLPSTGTTTTPTTTTTTPTTTPTTPTPTTSTTPTTTVPYPIAPTTTTPTTTTPTTTTPTTTTPTTTTPASEQTGQTTPTGGGGEVGLLLLSKYVKANSTDTLDYFNTFSLLSSLEEMFGVGHLGYARDPALPAFAKPQYNNYSG
jgi:hypothetical protein